MKTIHKIVSLLILYILSIKTAESQIDTTYFSRSMHLEEVTVTGVRYETDIRHLPMTVTVVNRLKIEDQHTPSLLPMLTEQVPGLFITSRGLMGYGISGGSAGNISLRGLGGSSARMMVLIDGHPQYMGIMGHPISDAHQSMMTERVEVLRGPASVLYGSNAMGGVINIVTRKMRKDGVNTQADIGYGSYNTFQSEVTNQICQGKFASMVGISYNRTDGHREDMDFKQYGGYAKIEYEWNDHWELGADINLTQFKAAHPGSLTEPLMDADQRITRGMTSFTLENRYTSTSGSLGFFYNWGSHKINDGYHPIEESPLDYRFHSNDKMLGVTWYQNFQLFEGNRTTIGADWYHFGGKAWNQFVTGSKVGQQTEIVDKNQNEIAGYVDIQQHLSTLLTINAGLRVDNHDQVGTEWIPQLGAAIHFPKNAEVKLSASRGFRYPIIREMFMWGIANPDLKAESIWNYEFSFMQNLMDNRMMYGINLFYINGDNMITTASIDGRVMNVNTGKIQNKGVEIQASYHLSSSWMIDANYSYLKMKYPVIASPEHKAYGCISYHKNRWRISSSVQYVGGLYKSLSSEDQEDYVLWNMKGSYKVNKNMGIWLKGENLLAQSYEVMSGYPMPGATFMCGVRLNF